MENYLILISLYEKLSSTRWPNKLGKLALSPSICSVPGLLIDEIPVYYFGTSSLSGLFL